LIDKSVSEFLNDPDRGERKHHILLLHEEPEYGRMIEYYFLKSGLEKGERSVYVILEKESVESIENQMEDFGINVAKFRKENLLHISQVPDPLEHPNGVVAGIQAAFQKSLANIRPPYRVTDRLFPTPINKLEPNIARNILDAERSFHQSLQELDMAAMYLCSYSVDDIGELLSDTTELAEGMLNSHNGAIYSTLTGSLALRFD
jgi:hypothetical protein